MCVCVCVCVCALCALCVFVCGVCLLLRVYKSKCVFFCRHVKFEFKLNETLEQTGIIERTVYNDRKGSG